MHVLLVDDHTLFREALFSVLQKFDATIAVIDAATAEEAIRLTRHYQDLDLIVLDLGLPDAQGVSLVHALRTIAPSVPMAVLSASEDVALVRDALDAGAAGYIPKSSTSHETIAALRLIMEGEIYIPPALLVALDALPVDTAEPPPPPPVRNPPHADTRVSPQLSPRQLEVLALIAEGLPNKLIARRLNLAPGTIKLHVAAILRALNAKNRTEALSKATQIRLLDPSNDRGT